MGFAGDAALTALPVVGDFLSGLSNASSMKNAYKHRYRWQNEDLRKAGLNPSLAYGSQPQTPQVGTMPDLGSSAARGLQMAKEGKQTTQQARLTASQAAVNEATAADQIAAAKLKNLQIGAQTENTRSGTLLNRANVPLIGQKIAESKATTENLGQQTRESQERIQLIKAQTNTTQAQARQINTTIAQMQQDMRWQRATWDVKISLLQKELQQAGVNIQLSRLEKLGRELGLNEQRADSRFYGDFGETGATGARELVKMILQYLK